MTFSVDSYQKTKFIRFSVSQNSHQWADQPHPFHLVNICSTVERVVSPGVTD